MIVITNRLRTFSVIEADPGFVSHCSGTIGRQKNLFFEIVFFMDGGGRGLQIVYHFWTP